MGGMIEPVVIVVFAYLVFTEIRNYHERKNIMDRLMARDFPEFVSYENERKKATIPDKIKREDSILL